MQAIYIILGVISLIVIFIVYRLITVKRQKNELNDERFERIKPLYDKLESGQLVSEIQVLPFAQNMMTREMSFQLLSDREKTHLFPKEFNTIIAAAESNLANWLEFPTELDACPDEIEHIERVTFDFDGENNYVHYEVFKCRVNEPHWAAKDG